MEKFSYLLFILIFSVPSLTFLFLTYKKQILKNMPLLITAIVFSIVYGLIADPVGIVLGAWTYDVHKSLGTTFTGAQIETILLGIAMATFFVIVVIVFAEREEKKKPFWPLW